MPVNLLKLSDLSISEINALLSRAQKFRDGRRPPVFKDKIACNLFFESSTRTQYSFNVAEEKLRMRVVSFCPQTSSLNKSETFYDTVKVFDCFHPAVLVIRHPETDYYNQLLGKINTPIINGGDGTGNHPTQSLLDLLTIKQEFGSFDGLKITIVGDICHSRVAHTNKEVMERLGMQVSASGPEQFAESGWDFIPFEQALTQSDIIMPLRVQFERHRDDGSSFSNSEYHRVFGLSSEKVKLMKKNAIIMHPAPVNRGTEIADDVVECPQSRIFRQMENGVFVRMAVIERSLS